MERKKMKKKEYIKNGRKWEKKVMRAWTLPPPLLFARNLGEPFGHLR